MFIRSHPFIDDSASGPITSAIERSDRHLGNLSPRKYAEKHKFHGVLSHFESLRQTYDHQGLKSKGAGDPRIAAADKENDAAVSLDLALAAEDKDASGDTVPCEDTH